MANNNTFFNLVVDNERIGAKKLWKWTCKPKVPTCTMPTWWATPWGRQNIAPLQVSGIGAIALSVGWISGGGGGR